MWRGSTRDAAAAAAAGAPSLGDVDLVYDFLLPKSLDAVAVAAVGAGCPRSYHAPAILRAPHSPLVMWYASVGPPARRVAASHTWIEVTHCGGSTYEERGAWFYAARGSALWIDVGRTLAFDTHTAAARRFLGVDRCADGPTCDAEMGRFAAAAAAAGYDSLQFTGHCDLECGECGHEVLLTKARGADGCPAGVDFRTGAAADRPCTCEESFELHSARGYCAACREWQLPRRPSAAVRAIGGGWNKKDGWPAFVARAVEKAAAVRETGV